MPVITAFDQNGLKVVFSLEKVPDSNTLNVNVAAVNNTLSNMSDFLFQAAVPKVINVCFVLWEVFNCVLVVVDIPIANNATFRNTDDTWWPDYTSFASYQS